MTAGLAQLAADVAQALGVEPPRVLSGDAAALLPDASAGQAPPYLIGLIGGKDVGKTSLANAIAGVELSPPIGHGRGTERAIAYAHERAVPLVRETFAAEAGEDYTIVPHRHDGLLRQVLVDLPDVDSKYAGHVALTRQMLRHMLFPVWVQSVEKYADAAPQELLAQVAEGNDPANFLFVLNKADQVIDAEGLDAAGELAADYAGRLQRLLKLGKTPDVYLVAAHRPDDYDLPRLREALQTQRSARDVKQARELAHARRESSLAAWVRAQDLPEKAARAARLRDEVADAVAAELAGPLIEEAIPATLADAPTRAALVEPAVAAAVRRWPVVNLLDVAAAPLIALVRKNLAPAGQPAATPDARLAEAGRPVSARIRGVFAELHATHDRVGELYAGRRLWEQVEADAAAGALRRDLAAALARHRRAAGTLPRRPWLGPWRWLLTLGVIVWFPILQPIAQVLLLLAPGDGEAAATTAGLPGLGGYDDLGGWRDLGLTVVSVLSAQHLLDSALFLLIWFVVLWAYLRWSAGRKALGRLGGRDDGLTAAAAAWCDDLIAPAEAHAAALGELARRAEAVSDKSA